MIFSNGKLIATIEHFDIRKYHCQYWQKKYTDTVDMYLYILQNILIFVAKYLDIFSTINVNGRKVLTRVGGWWTLCAKSSGKWHRPWQRTPTLAENQYNREERKRRANIFNRSTTTSKELIWLIFAEGTSSFKIISICSLFRSELINCLTFISNSRW